MSGGVGGNLENFTKDLHHKRYYENFQHFFSSVILKNTWVPLLELGATHLVPNIDARFLANYYIASKGRVSCTVLRSP